MIDAHGKTAAVNGFPMGAAVAANAKE